MGAWGYGVEDNDRYMDFYGMLKDEFNKCVPIEEAINNILREGEAFCGRSLSGLHNLYYACATAGWEYGHLSETLFDKVKEAIEIESDPKSGYWSEVSRTNFRLRKKYLKEFLAKISVPNPNPKRQRSKPLARYGVYVSYGKGLYFKDKGELA